MDTAGTDAMTSWTKAVVTDIIHRLMLSFGLLVELDVGSAGNSCDHEGEGGKEVMPKDEIVKEQTFFSRRIAVHRDVFVHLPSLYRTCDRALSAEIKRLTSPRFDPPRTGSHGDAEITAVILDAHLNRLGLSINDEHNAVCAAVRFNIRIKATPGAALDLVSRLVELRKVEVVFGVG